MEQATPSEKISSQTVEIKDKTNQKKSYLEQNISNHKLDRSDKKANTNTSPEIKISHNAEQATPSEKISSQIVEIKDKTNKKTHIYNKIYLTINQIDQTKNKIPKLQQK